MPAERGRTAGNRAAVRDGGRGGRTGPPADGEPRRGGIRAGFVDADARPGQDLVGAGWSVHAVVGRVHVAEPVAAMESGAALIHLEQVGP